MQILVADEKFETYLSFLHCMIENMVIENILN